MGFEFFSRVRNIHFIGIGGASMSALAKAANAFGYAVSGSDRALDSEMIANLPFCSRLYSEHRKEYVCGADVVVYSDSIPEQNCELCAARLSGALTLSRSDFLKILAREYGTVVSVAGSHGKSSTTTMLAYALRSAGAGFAVHKGCFDQAFGNFSHFGNRYFITEACEYRQNLLRIPSDVAVLLNVDYDHPDSYPTEESLLKAMHRFLAGARLCVVNGDEGEISVLREGLRVPCVTFGESSGCDFYLTDVTADGNANVLEIAEQVGRVKIRLTALGDFQIKNALAAYATARTLGFSSESAVKGLQEFSSVRRRFEKIGEIRGAPIVCDYAHHPSEIKAATRSARRLYGNRLIVIFQPHTYSRTKALFDGFTDALCGFERLILLPTYSARENYDGEGSTERLQAILKTAKICQNAREIGDYLQNAERFDAVLFLGAGDIYGMAISVAKALGTSIY